MESARPRRRSNHWLITVVHAGVSAPMPDARITKKPRMSSWAVDASAPAMSSSSMESPIATQQIGMHTRPPHRSSATPSTGTATADSVPNIQYEATTVRATPSRVSMSS